MKKLEATKQDYAIQQAQRMFARYVTLYDHNDSDILFKLYLAYALLVEFKRDSTVEVFWDTQPCPTVVLNDGHRLKIKEMHELKLFYKDEEWSSEIIYHKLNARTRAISETMALYDAIVDELGEDQFVKFAEANLE